MIIILAYLLGVLTPFIVSWILRIKRRIAYLKTPGGQWDTSFAKFLDSNWIEDFITKEQKKLMKEHNVSVFVTGSGAIMAYRHTHEFDYYDDVLGYIDLVKFTIPATKEEQRDGVPDYNIIDFEATGENIRTWVKNWVDSRCKLPKKTRKKPSHLYKPVTPPSKRF